MHWNYILVKNPLPIELTLDSVSSQAGLNGTVFATFTHTFPKPGLVVPPLGTKNSGTIDNVLLTQGAIASLDIIPFGVLNLNTDANIRYVSNSLSTWCKTGIVDGRRNPARPQFWDNLEYPSRSTVLHNLLCLLSKPRTFSLNCY